jgi:hypothetical protein
VHQCAVGQYLGQVFGQSLAVQRGDGRVVLGQGGLVAPGPPQQQSALTEQQPGQAGRGQSLGLVQQREPAVDVATLGVGPGQADQDPGPQFRVAGLAELAERGAQVPGGRLRMIVAAGRQAEGVAFGSRRHGRGCGPWRGHNAKDAVTTPDAPGAAGSTRT